MATATATATAATAERRATEGDRLLTAEEYFALPPDGRKTELVDGRIVEVCVPTAVHALAEKNITWHLENWCRTHKTGRVLTGDGGVRTTRSPDSVRGADVQYLSFDRLPKGELPARGYPDAKPEVVFEVRSPNDSPRRMADKAEEYLEAGVDAVVCVDPIAETATLHRVGAAAESLAPDDELTIEDLLPGFAVRVAELFVE